MSEFLVGIDAGTTGRKPLGLDLDAVLATAFGSLDAVGRSTLLDITDGEDRGRLYVE